VKQETKRLIGMVSKRNLRSRQSARTETTRRKLLAAAERIFARDGFEAARLEDIAAGAGYTRGAFYANFSGKEDIFFALLDEWVRQRIDSVAAAVRKQQSPERKLAALRKYYVEIAKDRRLVLNALEFKLFALRHPKAHARLQARHRHLRATWGELFAEVSKALGRELAIANSAASAACGSLALGLLLEQLVDPKSLSEKDVHYILDLFFDAIFQLNGTKSARVSKKL
jgi:AcrR family transcriptional regulator